LGVLTYSDGLHPWWRREFTGCFGLTDMGEEKAPDMVAIPKCVMSLQFKRGFSLFYLYLSLSLYLAIYLAIYIAI
jgi:hypothetical protein